MRISRAAATARTPRRRGFWRHDLDDLGTAGGQGTGLVERHGREATRDLEQVAALDEDTVASRRRQAGDDADWGRDDQGARTADHQQNQGAVEPVSPGAESHKGGNHRGEDRPHRRPPACRRCANRSTQRSACARRRPASATCRMIRASTVSDDGMRQPRGRGCRRGRSSRRSGATDLQRLGPRLSGNRGRVHQRRALHYLAVEGDPLPGLDHHEVPTTSVSATPHVLARSRIAEPGERWCQLHELLYRPPGAGDAPRLEQERQGEEERNRRGFEPLADEDCTAHRHRHQQVHVGTQGAGRTEGPRHDEPGTRDDREEVGERGREGNGLALTVGQTHRGQKLPVATVSSTPTRVKRALAAVMTARPRRCHHEISTSWLPAVVAHQPGLTDAPRIASSGSRRPARPRSSARP